MEYMTKRQFTKLLRELQKLQAGFIYTSITFDINSYGLLGSDNSQGITVYVSDSKTLSTISYHTIYSFYSYEENQAIIEQIKNKLNTYMSNAKSL